MAEGFFGFLDFTGLPVGEGFVLPPPGGFFGFLDFVGYPVAEGIGGAVPPKPAVGHGFRGAGRFPYLFLSGSLSDRRNACRKLVTARMTRELLTTSLIHKTQEQGRIRSKELAENAMYSVLLAEI